jgi:hypothetical protein
LIYTQYEVADIFRLYGDQYLGNHQLTERQHKAFNDIIGCRTQAMGFHVDQCDLCGYTEPSYNSCRNRNCPKCQGSKQIKWVQDRLNDLLPVTYFHAVFTIPNQTFNIAIYNQKIFYDLLFSCSAETMKQFAGNAKWWDLSEYDEPFESMDIQPGFFSTLHTWGQTLSFHPHIHIIAAGGGIRNNSEWVWPKYGKKFLFPVKAMAKVFRGKYIEGLKTAYYNDELQLPGQLEVFKNPRVFETWINDLVNRDWVSYCKAPFDGPGQVIEYVGRYTHRVAINNHRIQSIEDGKVTFRYKDYKNDGKKRNITLDAEEFITRFLHHVLPKRFHRLRHYGFLSNGNTGLRTALELLILEEEVSNDKNEELAEKYFLDTDTIRNCPICHCGRMTTVFAMDKNGRIVKGEDLVEKKSLWDLLNPVDT